MRGKPSSTLGDLSLNSCREKSARGADSGAAALGGVPKGPSPAALPLAPVPPCRKCGPRLSAGAAEKLKNRYVLMRSGTRQHEQESDRRSSIPITVR